MEKITKHNEEIFVGGDWLKKFLLLGCSVSGRGPSCYTLVVSLPHSSAMEPWQTVETRRRHRAGPAGGGAGSDQQQTVAALLQKASELMATTAKAPPAGPQPTTEQWTCQLCAKRNWLSRKSCRGCGLRKGKQQKQASESKAVSAKTVPAQPQPTMPARPAPWAKSTVKTAPALTASSPATVASSSAPVTTSVSKEPGESVSDVVDTYAEHTTGQLREELNKVEQAISSLQVLNQHEACTAPLEKRKQDLLATIGSRQAPGKRLDKALHVEKKAKEYSANLEHQIETLEAQLDQLQNELVEENCKEEKARADVVAARKMVAEEDEPEALAGPAIPPGSVQQLAVNITAELARFPAIGLINPAQVESWLQAQLASKPKEGVGADEVPVPTELADMDARRNCKDRSPPRAPDRGPKRRPLSPTGRRSRSPNPAEAAAPAATAPVTPVQTAPLGPTQLDAADETPVLNPSTMSQSVLAVPH